MKVKRLARTLFKIAGVLALTGFLAFAALIATLAVDHTSALTLPTPSGPFAVGRTTTYWLDPEHTDAFAPSPQTKRELAVWLWYPAIKTDGAQPADYLPPAWQKASEGWSGPIGSLLNRDLSKIRVHSLRDPAVASGQPAYPVLIMRAGSGALVANFTTLAEDLASHGYIVAGFDAPWRTGTLCPPRRQRCASAAGKSSRKRPGPASRRGPCGPIGGRLEQ